MTRDILSGPAVIQFGGTAAANTFYTTDDIVVTQRFETEDIVTSQFGKVDRLVKDRVVEITFTPIGVWAGGSTAFTDKVALLWPYLTGTIGAGIFPTTQAAEKVLHIWTISDGLKYTFQSCAITQMPSLTLSAEKIICGPVTVRAIEELAASTNLIQAWSVDESVFAQATVAFTDTSFATTDILIDSYTAAWGSITGFTALQTMEGFTVEFGVETTPISVDSYGVVQMLLSDVTATCKFVPVGGPTHANCMAAMKFQNTGSARGMSVNGINSNTDLIISGSAAGKPKVTIKGAQLISTPMRFGMTQTRLGELEFQASLTTAAAAKTVAAIGTV